MIVAPFALLLLAVSGTVVNKSTGQAQKGATVTLYKVGGAGPEAMTSVKSGADGSFSMDDTPQGAPHMLQTAWDGVLYTHMLPPGAATTGIGIDVYDATRKPVDARVSTHMILLEPDGMNLNVNESVIWRNQGKLAFNDPQGGTLRFYLPPGARGKVRVTATGPGSIPIERAAEKTTTANVYRVDFAVRPGESRFDLTYAIPMTGPGEFATRILHGGGPVRVVAPVGVTVTGSALQLLGQEPATQASVFEVKGAEIQAAVSGTGSLRAPEGGGGSAEGGDEDGGEGLKQIRPRLYERFYSVLGLAVVVLVAALLLLYRKPAPTPDGKQG